MSKVLYLASERHHPLDVDFEQIFDSLPDPAVLITPNKEIAACNGSFRERFPVVIEERFIEMVNPSRGETAANAGTSVTYVEPKRQSITGGRTWPALRPRLTRLPDGGLLVVFNPVSPSELEHFKEINELREQLRLTQEQLSSALDAVTTYKKNFAEAGHELRTPLNAIVGFSDMMRQETLGPLGDGRYKRYADIIHDSGKRLLHAINDVLDFAKLDAGKLELRVEEVEALAVVVESVRELECLAVKAGVGISVHVCDGVSVVMADRLRLRQMLANILSNAIKFTPEGGEIGIDIFKRGGKVAISVSDTGLGMQEADVAIAMQPFGQVKRPTEKAREGTGLGLPLTKQLAELHGGAIELKSVAGFGTTVIIMLPTEGPPL